MKAKLFRWLARRLLRLSNWCWLQYDKTVNPGYYDMED